MRPVPQLDRLIHERVRLAVVSALAANEVLSFNELKNLLATTDGNLSVHARKLEEAGYVACRKGFAGRVPSPFGSCHVGKVRVADGMPPPAASAVGPNVSMSFVRSAPKRRRI